MTEFPHASQCRVLVVEDAPEFQTRIAKLFAAKRIRVQTASNYAQALQVIQRERFHIALIDVCLDKNDPTNRAGEELGNQLRRLDPSAGIIMMDDHLDPQFMRDILRPSAQNASVYDVSRARASQYIEKTEPDLSNLLKMVQEIFDGELRINFNLHIRDSEQLLRMIASQIVLPEPKPGPHEILVELTELIRKLFFKWQRVEILPIANQRRGYSKAYVFQAIPFDADGQGAKLIVKLGAQALIGEEVRRYQEHIQHKTQNQLYPTAIMPVCRTKSLGGIVYSFAGLTDQVRDFAEFFRSTNDNEIVAPVIRHIFSGTLRLQLTGTKTTRHDNDLSRTYREMLRLKDDELVTQHGELLLRLGAVRVPTRPEFFWLRDGVQMVDPLHFAQITNFRISYSEATIHGDLHAHNILLDGNDTGWLIDFADTCKGPRFQDFVALEASIMFENNDCQDIDLLLRWTRELFSQPGDLLLELTPELAAVPELAKVHGAIQAIRAEAQSYMTNPELDKQAYLVGLFFTALRMMTVKFLPDGRRFHALAVASMAAENLIVLEKQLLTSSSVSPTSTLTL